MVPNKTSNRILLLIAGVLSALCGVLLLTFPHVTVVSETYMDHKLYKTSVIVRNFGYGADAISFAAAALFLFALICIISAFRREYGKKIRWVWLLLPLAATILTLAGILNVNGMRTRPVYDQYLYFYIDDIYEVRSSAWLLFAGVVIALVPYCIHLLIGQSAQATPTPPPPLDDPYGLVFHSSPKADPFRQDMDKNPVKPSAPDPRPEDSPEP